MNILEKTSTKSIITSFSKSTSQQKRIALVIGISEYLDDRLPELSSSFVDAEKMTEVLMDKNIGNFEVRKHVNLKASELMREMEIFYKEKKTQNYLYFSGCAIINEYNIPFLCAKDTNLELPYSTAICSSFINNLMKQTTSTNLIILDCSYSENFHKSNSFDNCLFLTSCRSFEQSFNKRSKDGEIPNGIFTFYLVEGLKTGKADYNFDGNISLYDIHKYTSDKIASQKIHQTPSLWLFGMQQEPYLVKKQVSPFYRKENINIDKLNKIYKNSHAIIIGISNYQNENRLPNAYNDASSIQKTLESYGFNILISYYNEHATFPKIREIFQDIIHDEKKISKQDRLLIIILVTAN
jgi:Caspase domain